MTKRKKPATLASVLDGWLEIPEAAQRIGMKADTLRQHCFRGTAPAEKVGGMYLFHRDTLDRWNETRRRPGRPKRI